MRWLPHFAALSVRNHLLFKTPQRCQDFSLLTHIATTESVTLYMPRKADCACGTRIRGAAIAEDLGATVTTARGALRQRRYRTCCQSNLLEPKVRRGDLTKSLLSRLGHG